MTLSGFEYRKAPLFDDYGFDAVRLPKPKRVRLVSAEQASAMEKSDIGIDTIFDDIFDDVFRSAVNRKNTSLDSMFDDCQKANTSSSVIGTTPRASLCDGKSFRGAFVFG